MDYLQTIDEQALDERQGEDGADGHFHEALHGVLIGADADRVREEVTRCGPEKKTEGLFAGLAKWSKEKGDSVNGLSVGAEASEPRGRIPSWIAGDNQAADGVPNPKTNADVVASRGKGGIGRRDAKDLFTEDSNSGSQGQGTKKTKEPKRRLFGGVSNRFDRSDASARGGGSAGSGGSTETGSGRAVTDTRQWRTPGRMRASKAEATLSQGAGGLSSATSPEASGGESREEGSRKGSGGWVKPQKGGPTPDRFTRFLGKMLGVRDDALQDGTSAGSGGGGGGSSGGGLGEDIVGAAGIDASPGPLGVPAGTRSPSAAAGGESLQGARGSATELGASSSDVGGRQQDASSLPVSAGAPARTDTPAAIASGGTPATTSSSAGAATSSAGALSSGVVAAAASAELEPVTATAVYPATTISTATADAMPMAVAVAFPVEEGTASAIVPGSGPSSRRPSRTAAGGGSEPAATSTRRPSRTSRPHRAATTTTPAGRTEGETTPAVGSGEAVSISEWVDMEQRESGGRVRVFSAQRVLGSKVQKKCRLAVSPKTMTQFDDVEDGDWATGGARGVITEHRGLRHLSRITSRKKHADLIVFHFKSRSGSSSSVPAASGSAAGAPGSSSSSRRSRTKPSAEREPAAGQPDVLFYFMREHAECLRMVKDNYRKVTQGGSGGDSSSKPSSRSSASASASSLSVRRGAGGDTRGDSSRAIGGDNNRKTTRQTARAAAGAAAGAAGIVVGAAAGMAVGAAAGVAVGAAFLAGHRKGSHGDDRTKSSSPTRFRQRGGSEGTGGAIDDADLVNNGWVPITAPRGERRRVDAGGVGSGSGVVRPASAGGAVSSRRPSSTAVASGGGRGHSRARGAGSADSSSADRTAKGGGPRWLGPG